jgi:hypothetical protein
MSTSTKPTASALRRPPYPPGDHIWLDGAWAPVVKRFRRQDLAVGHPGRGSRSWAELADGRFAVLDHGGHAGWRLAGPGDQRPGGLDARGRPAQPAKTGFGRALYLARIAAGLNQSEAAERCGVDRNSLAAWERGEQSPVGGAVRREDLLRRLTREGD